MKGIARIAELEDRMAVDDARARTAHPWNEKGSFSCTFLNYWVTNPKQMLMKGPK